MTPAPPQPEREALKLEELEVLGRWLSEAALWTGDDYLWLNRFRGAMRVVEQLARERGFEEKRADRWMTKAHNALETLRQANDNTEQAEQERDELREVLNTAHNDFRDIAESSPNWMEPDAVVESERRKSAMARAAQEKVDAALSAHPKTEEPR